MIYLIIASLLWAFSFGLTKGHLVDLNPSFVAWARLAIALPVFLPFLRVKGMSFARILHLVLIGSVQYGLTYTFYLFSFQYLESYQIAILTIFTPIYVTLIDSVYRKKLIWINFAMALLAVIGAGVINYKNISYDDLLVGFLLMQAANICFSLGQLEYRRWRRLHEVVKDREVYALLIVGAVIIASIATTWNGGWGSLGAATLRQWSALLYLGVFATGLGFYLWNVGAVKTGAGTLAVLNNAKIPLAVFVSIVFFQEDADLLRLFIGGGLMVLAVVLTEYFSSKRAH